MSKINRAQLILLVIAFLLIPAFTFGNPSMGLEEYRRLAGYIVTILVAFAVEILTIFLMLKIALGFKPSFILFIAFVLINGITFVCIMLPFEAIIGLLLAEFAVWIVEGFLIRVLVRFIEGPLLSWKFAYSAALLGNVLSFLVGLQY